MQKLVFYTNALYIHTNVTCFFPRELDVYAKEKKRDSGNKEEFKNDNSWYYNDRFAALNVKDASVQSCEVYLWNNTLQITTVLKVRKIS